MKKTDKSNIEISQPGISMTSKISGFKQMSIEKRLSLLAAYFNFSPEQAQQIVDGDTLKIDQARNMVENAIGVFGLPLGVALYFLVDGKDHIVPMAIEEASIIAAASKAAKTIRRAGGFHTTVGDPVMIGQIQVLDLDDPGKAAREIHLHKEEVLEQANIVNHRMVERGGGAFDLETRVINGGSGVGPMLVIHVLIDVREAMGANAVNYGCEAAGPIIEQISGGRVNLRIVSNLADRRLARSEFALPFDCLAFNGYSGEEVAIRMVEASRMAWADPYRATTHNKGIFNGLCAAALALGQDWRAIEAGGHAYAARDGQYRGLSTYRIEGKQLMGELELPLQVGWIGGAVKTHPGVFLLRRVSAVESSRELAGLLASVGLGQNFAACLALSTVGIQKGHMALHARSVALAAGVPQDTVEKVAREMIRRDEVKLMVAKEIFRSMKPVATGKEREASGPVEAFAPGKVVLFGEHATVYGHPGISAAIDSGITIRITHDSEGPRFLPPRFKQIFSEVKVSDGDLVHRAVKVALSQHDLHNEPIAIHVDSDIPPGIGLGSSASFSAALCLALREYRDINGKDDPESDLFDEVQKLESVFHGTPSGMDTATVLSRGAIYYRKGPPREIVPIRIPITMTGLVCVVEPGASTLDQVRFVRQRRSLEGERIDGILAEIKRITALAGSALGNGNIPKLGELMTRNHRLLGKLGVSTPDLNKAVDLLCDRGAFGAKLTGAGGGGAVIALVRPDEQYSLVESLSNEFPLVFSFTLGAKL